MVFRAGEKKGLVLALERLFATRPMSWFFVNLARYIDIPLLRLTNGRLSLGLGVPVLLLTTTGAKSGQPRTVPLAYITSGEEVVLIASRGGDTRHPAWYLNLKKNPEVTLQLPGRKGSYVARDTVGEEREALWRRATEVFSGYDTYQARAGARQIPVVVLTPKQ